MEGLMKIIRKSKQSVVSMVMDGVIAYFKPLFYIASLFDKTISSETKIKMLVRRYEASLTTLQAIKKAVCFNQGEYLQYTFLTAEKHRTLKDTFRERPDDFPTLTRLFQELTDYVNRHFYEDVHENFKLLHAYFHKRGNKMPRICLKGNFKTPNKEKIVSVFRDRIVSYDSDTEIEKNYGFQYIYKTGTYYIENNIPKAVMEDRYTNPRLDNSLVKELMRKSDNTPAKLWRDCWIGDKSDASSCYKSTLIIPMTLWNNRVDEEFKELFNMENVDRTIFGFLCFDHVDENYFDQEHDVSVGYVFADLLSMYVFTRLTYMEISKTYSAIEKQLSEQKISVKTEKLKSAWKELPSVQDLNAMLNVKIIRSNKNDLYPIDNNLIEYIHPITWPPVGQV